MSWWMLVYDWVMVVRYGTGRSADADVTYADVVVLLYTHSHSYQLVSETNKMLNENSASFDVALILTCSFQIVGEENVKYF